MRTINASKFKEQCLALLDSVSAEGILITKHSKPVARVVPANDDPASLVGALKGKLIVRGDILSTGIRWDAES